MLSTFGKRSSIVLVLLFLLITVAVAAGGVARPGSAALAALGWPTGQAAVLGVAATVTPAPGVVTPRDAFAALQARTPAPLMATWDAVTGLPDFITAADYTQPLPYTPTAAEAGNPAAIARGFLDENRALFRLRSAADELRVGKIEPDLQLNYHRIRLDQVYKGIPVYGQRLIVGLNPSQQIVAVNGQFTPGIDVPTEPLVSKDDAHALAIENVRDVQMSDTERATATFQVLADRTQLMIHVGADGKPTLTWRVALLSHAPLGQWHVFVNARRLAVTHSLESTAQDMRRVTFTARNSTNLPGRKLADEGEVPQDAIARAAHDGAGIVYNYYFTKFGRDSLDGQGSPLVSTVNYGSSAEDAENAAWIGELQQMIYGDGGRMFKPLALGLTVVGHEFTHGVIDNTAQLVYEAQSGALNESFADVFGVLISQSNWEVGREVIKSPPYPLPFLRSLANPNAGRYNPRNPLQGVGQPGHMNEYANLPVSRRADNGGVHINSGIPNRAAFLIAQALGGEKAEQVFYRAMTQYLTPRSNFLNTATAEARAAQELYGAAEADAVRDAWGQVGVTIGSGDTGPTQQTPQRPSGSTAPAPAPAPQLPQGCSDVVTDGGFETDGAWRQIVGKGSAGIIDSELPHSGNRSAWLGGTDKETPQIIYQNIQVPANAVKVTLSYYRNLHEETTGLLGAFSSPARFNALAATEQGDIIGAFERLTSEGAADEWQRAEFDATQFAGKTLRLAFSAENPKGNVSSMFIDDVQLVACTTGAGPAAPATGSDTLVYIQGRVQDADTGRGISGAQVFVLTPGVTARQAAADDRITQSEVLTMAVTDGDGVYRTQAAVPTNQVYSFIIFNRGYRPILADNEVSVPPNANNPHTVNAVMRQSR